MLKIYPVVIEVVVGVRGVVARIGRRDPALVDQLRRAAVSVANNLSEGAYSLGGNVRARFHDALGWGRGRPLLGRGGLAHQRRRLRRPSRPNT